MGETEEEIGMSRARALGGKLRVCICPEGMRSAWSLCARRSGGSLRTRGRERGGKDGDTGKQSTEGTLASSSQTAVQVT